MATLRGPMTRGIAVFRGGINVSTLAEEQPDKIIMPSASSRMQERVASAKSRRDEVWIGVEEPIQAISHAKGGSGKGVDMRIVPQEKLYPLRKMEKGSDGQRGPPIRASSVGIGAAC